MSQVLLALCPLQNDLYCFYHIQQYKSQKGVDFVNQLVRVYNRDSNNDKNQVALRTEAFIKERLAIISGELSVTENELEQYKRNTGLVDLKANAALSLKGNSEYSKRSAENSTQLNLINYLEQYIQNPKNVSEVIPTNVGFK